MSAGVESVQARIAEIQSRFSSVAGAATFAPVLQAATSARAMGLADVGGATPLTGDAVVVGDAAAAGDDVIAAGERYLGVPYVWGGTDPSVGLDCSGFVQRAYRDVGIELPRVSRDQARAGQPVASLADARPGDLVAFGSPVDHIGIYAGDGEMLVAPHRGDVVRRQEITATPTAIRRVLPDAPPAATGGFDGLFRAAEARNGLPPGVLGAVARVESGLDPRAVSGAGAQGLMQLMPATARSLGVDAFDPAQAVDGAGRLLASHLRRFGSLDLALAAYNAGPGAVARAGGVPPYSETQAYVRKVNAALAGVTA